MEVPRIEGSLNDVLGVKYSAGCALMLTIWDILITLNKEVTFVWSNSPGLPHIILVLTRYCNLVSLIYANYLLSGLGDNGSELQCKALPVIFGVLVLAFSLSYNVYVALHLYGLWDQRRRMRTVLCIAIAVLYIPVLSIVSLGLKTLYRDTMFLSALHTCILSGNDTFTKVAFGCMPAFDVFVILLTAYNVLDRPRRPQERFTVEMRRDGALWFLILFVMRMANFLCFVILPVRRIFIALLLILTVICLTISRMVIDVEAKRKVQEMRFSRPRSSKVRVLWATEQMDRSIAYTDIHSSR